MLLWTVTFVLLIWGAFNIQKVIALDGASKTVSSSFDGTDQLQNSTRTKSDTQRKLSTANKCASESIQQLFLGSCTIKEIQTYNLSSYFPANDGNNHHHSRQHFVLTNEQLRSFLHKHNCHRLQQERDAAGQSIPHVNFLSASTSPKYDMYLPYYALFALSHHVNSSVEMIVDNRTQFVINYAWELSLISEHLTSLFCVRDFSPLARRFATLHPSFASNSIRFFEVPVLRAQYTNVGDIDIFIHEDIFALATTSSLQALHIQLPEINGKGQIIVKTNANDDQPQLVHRMNTNHRHHHYYNISSSFLADVHRAMDRHTLSLHELQMLLLQLPYSNVVRHNFRTHRLTGVFLADTRRFYSARFVSLLEEYASDITKMKRLETMYSAKVGLWGMDEVLLYYLCREVHGVPLRRGDSIIVDEIFDTDAPNTNQHAPFDFISDDIIDLMTHRNNLKYGHNNSSSSKNSSSNDVTNHPNLVENKAELSSKLQQLQYSAKGELLIPLRTRRNSTLYYTVQTMQPLMMYRPLHGMHLSWHITEKNNQPLKLKHYCHTFYSLETHKLGLNSVSKSLRTSMDIFRMFSTNCRVLQRFWKLTVDK